MEIILTPVMRTTTSLHQCFDGHLMTVLVCVVMYEIDLQPLSCVVIDSSNVKYIFLGLVHFKFVQNI